ncbi:hypothetical protein [Methylobacterium nonmethylotrophicum]|uniref:Uncharacterized protein n=1 Tax=Methylobacterium nonmethylotrophicum TaxID=1141884 RepID=A0A4Z0NX56_9HYPH|nr:hypothetical protein [Methylobacterium nonmethylotrophicum]TGE02440.1 hypothetical protein EU555_01335 [Methylobacterium nonmethylotrophicum]
MNDIKSIARMLADEAGTAQPITRERPFPVSDMPMMVIPIELAGESPSLFALGVATGANDLQIAICHEPRNRTGQYDMLERAAGFMQSIVAAWDADPLLLPQIVTPSLGASRLALAVIDRMTFAPPSRQALKDLGRRIYVADSSFERADSSLVFDLPTALGRLYATGQDDHADQHLGVVLEWLKPADGRIHHRVREAEAYPASTATSPELDNEELVPRLEAYRTARRIHDAAEAARLEDEIDAILVEEVKRRHELMIQALAAIRVFPDSTVARTIQAADRGRFDRYRTYASNPANNISRGLAHLYGTAQFLEREFAEDLVGGLAMRSVSGERSAARLRGEIVVAEVLNRTITQNKKAITVIYELLSTQDRLSIRPGDKLVLLGPYEFGFKIRSYGQTQAGTRIEAELTAGKTKPGQPAIGDTIEIATPMTDNFRIHRTMDIAWNRFRSNRVLPQVSGPVPVQHDLLSIVQRARRLQPTARGRTRP